MTSKGYELELIFCLGVFLVHVDVDFILLPRRLWERKERVTEQENEGRGREDDKEEVQEEEEEEEKDAPDTSKDFPSAKAATYTLLSL